jgi:hypothetical protein
MTGKPELKSLDAIKAISFGDAATTASQTCAFEQPRLGSPRPAAHLKIFVLPSSSTVSRSLTPAAAAATRKRCSGSSIGS